MRRLVLALLLGLAGTSACTDTGTTFVFDGGADTRPADAGAGGAGGAGPGDAAADGAPVDGGAG